MFETLVSGETLAELVPTNIVTSWSTFYVLFRPFTHYLALISLHSPVDGDAPRGTLSNVSLDSLAVTHTVSAKIATTGVKQAVLVVRLRINDRVARLEYLIVYQPTHSFCKGSPEWIFLARSLFALLGISTNF